MAIESDNQVDHRPDVIMAEVLSVAAVEGERTTRVPGVIPARMLNEFAYCPRLAWLEWVQGEWEENPDTLEGAHVHRRVDQPEGARSTLHQRSLHLSSPRLGLAAVVDLVERSGRRIRPIDYKRGRKPPCADGAWEPERVQLCAQGLLLREAGYDCAEGVLYFAGSRERVRVRFTQQLVARTEQLLQQMRQVLEAAAIPAPLEDSPKCPRCSLVSICLPDEVNFLRRRGNIRPIAVTDRGLFPLIVQQPGSHVHLSGSRLRVIREGREEASVPLLGISQLVLMGGCSASGPSLRECCRLGVPVVHMSGTGWFCGITGGASHKNVELRAEQFAAARDENRRLAIARALVAAKISNSRVVLKRNGNPAERDLEILKQYAGRAAVAPSIEDALGIEGAAGKLYYSSFETMLKSSARDLPGFEMDGRNRRPPRDPMNALLSFGSALLTKDWAVALQAVGFDPLMGFYHRTRYGKPALALDMMEPFRPVIVDSVAIGLVNNGELRVRDFYEREGAVLLSPAARKTFLDHYERRLAMEVTHPVFGYRCSYRRVFELEARLLGRHLLGEVSAYEGFRVR